MENARSDWQIKDACNDTKVKKTEKEASNRNTCYINKNQVKSDEKGDSARDDEDSNEEELYSIPSDNGNESLNVGGQSITHPNDEVEEEDFYDVSSEYDDFYQKALERCTYGINIFKDGKLKEKEKRNDVNEIKKHTRREKEEEEKKNEISTQKDENKEKIRSKENKKKKDERRSQKKLLNSKIDAFSNLDLHEKIKSTIDLCVPKLKCFNESENKMLINMNKISNIYLENETSEEEKESKTTESAIRSLYENVDRIIDATNKGKLQVETENTTNADGNVSSQIEQTQTTATQKKQSDSILKNKEKKDETNSSIGKETENKGKSDTNTSIPKEEKTEITDDVKYYLSAPMVELNECINKLFNGCCDFKERSALTKKITTLVPELNNLYNSKNLCYIKDNPSVHEIEHIVPEWKKSFEQMNSRALKDTRDMAHILKRIENIKNDLYMLNKDLIEDREEFENVKFETVEHDSAVTLIEKKNKEYIKGALKLDNVGQKLKRAFNIPFNPITNFTVSEHINRLLNYEDELLMGNGFFGKYSQQQHCDILRFKNSNKKLELFEKEDGEACYVIDMLIRDVKQIYKEKKKEFEKIDKKMKLYELTDINKLKTFMDVTLNHHHICISEFQESMKDVITTLYDMYDHFARKNLKAKRIDECYIKNYVENNWLQLNSTENNVKKAKDEEKYFMSLNFTRKKPIDHPFFIYHCLSPVFMCHFVNFILYPESSENQKNFMQHCSLPGFNSVVFCQQILKLRKQEKEFTNSEFSYDFASAYSKVLCADLCSVVLKSYNNNNTVEQQTGVSKYLTALKNAADDYFLNISKKEETDSVYNKTNNAAIDANISRHFKDVDTMGMHIRSKTDTLFYRNCNHNKEVTNKADDVGCGFQLLHFIPDELTSISGMQTVICYDDSYSNGTMLSSVRNCDLNKFNILKVSSQHILSNASNEIFYRKIKDQIPLFIESQCGNETNESINTFLNTCIPTPSNMTKNNFLGSTEENLFTTQNNNILKKTKSTNMFSNDAKIANIPFTTTTTTPTANNNMFSRGSSIFGINTNNTTNLFAQGNTNTVGNNTTNNVFNTRSYNPFSSANTGNVFSNTSNSTNIFGTVSSGSSFSNNNNNNTNINSSTFGTNIASANATGTTSSTSIFANNTRSDVFGNTAANSIWGTQNSANSLLNKGTDLAANSSTPSGFGSSNNINANAAGGINTISNIFGNTTTNATNLGSLGNTSNIFNENKTNTSGNTILGGSTRNMFGNTSNNLFGTNNNSSSTPNGSSNVFGLFGKSDGNALGNKGNISGNASSSIIFTGNTANHLSNAFTSNFTGGTTSIFGSNNNSGVNKTILGSAANNTFNNTNTSANTFGLSKNTNPCGINNFTSASNTGGIFNSMNNTSSLFGNTANNNTKSSLFGRNESSTTGNNNSIFGKAPATNSGSIFDSMSTSMNNTGLMNNSGTNNCGFFDSMGQKQNMPSTNFSKNNMFTTNTSNSFQPLKNTPFPSSLDQSKFSNSGSFFSTGNPSTANNRDAVNSTLFGMNNSSSGIATSAGVNSAISTGSNIFGNKPGAITSGNSIFGQTGTSMRNNSFNNNSSSNNMFSVNQSSFFGKANPSSNSMNTLSTKTNPFSSKINTDTCSSSIFGSNNQLGFATNTNANTNMNNYTKGNIFGAAATLPPNENRNMNSGTTNVFGSNQATSTSSIFGSNSKMGTISFNNSLLNSNTSRGGLNDIATGNSLLGTGNKLFDSNTFGSNMNSNINTNNSASTLDNKMFMSNAFGQNISTNRDTPFENTVNNRPTPNLFAKNNLGNSTFLNSTNTGNTTTGLFQNHQNTFSSSNRTGGSLFGMNSHLQKNTTNSNSNSMFQNNSLLIPGKPNIPNTNTKGFNF